MIKKKYIGLAVTSVIVLYTINKAVEINQEAKWFNGLTESQKELVIKDRYERRQSTSGITKLFGLIGVGFILTGIGAVIGSGGSSDSKYLREIAERERLRDFRDGLG